MEVSVMSKVGDGRNVLIGGGGGVVVMRSISLITGGGVSSVVGMIGVQVFVSSHDSSVCSSSSI